MPGTDGIHGQGLSAEVRIDLSSSFDRPGGPPAAEHEPAERILGRALAGRRDEVVIATKSCVEVGPGVNDRGLSRRHIIQQVANSLRSLERTTSTSTTRTTPGQPGLGTAALSGLACLVAVPPGRRSGDRRCRDGRGAHGPMPRRRMSSSTKPNWTP